MGVAYLAYLATRMDKTLLTTFARCSPTDKDMLSGMIQEGVGGACLLSPISWPRRLHAWIGVFFELLGECHTFFKGQGGVPLKCIKYPYLSMQPR